MVDFSHFPGFPDLGFWTIFGPFLDTPDLVNLRTSDLESGVLDAVLGTRTLCI